VTAQNWLDIVARPAANLPAADRLRLFREGRLAGAAVMICLFPLLAFAWGETAAVTAALLLAALLPAVVALDARRPALIDRACVFHVMITGALMTAAVLRGLPATSAFMLVCLAAVEAFLCARRAGRDRAMAAALAGFAAIAIAAQGATAASPAASGSLALAALALCGTVVLTRGLLRMYQREKHAGVRDRMLSSEVEAVVSETVVAVDRAGRVVRVSANAGRVLGLSPAALMGRGLAELTLVADRPALLSAFGDSTAAASRQKIRFRLRQSTDHASPRYRWAELALGPSVVGGLAVASLKDVSADVLEEERLAEVAAEAESAKSARAAFLTTVSHELRTPLNAIIGFSEILANPMTSPKDVEKVREYARIVNGAGQDLLRMVSAMIDITRIDSGIYGFEAEEADLAALVETAIESYRQEPEAAGAAITFTSDGQTMRAAVDSRALRCVLQQLLSNAVKFGKGREIAVSVSDIPGGLGITVRDSGDGIAAGKLEMLGRHFARLDESLGRDQGGVGLGLSLARGLMALHGGWISLESQTGKGTAVTLHLPVPGSAAPGRDNVLMLDVARRDEQAQRAAAKSSRGAAPGRTERKRA
jgi:two-component system, cell cycle sensor histidine kinase DivJ